MYCHKICRTCEAPDPVDVQAAQAAEAGQGAQLRIRDVAALPEGVGGLAAAEGAAQLQLRQPARAADDGQQPLRSACGVFKSQVLGLRAATVDSSRGAARGKVCTQPLHSSRTCHIWTHVVFLLEKTADNSSCS